MCIAVFIWQSHPIYPFLLLLNRDEYHNRPTKPLAWWEGGEIVGGRDGLAGGTWLACTRGGRVAFLTNVREVKKQPLAKSRGDLPVRFLESKKNPMEFAEELVGEADQYNGFNLIIADLCSKTMVYITNRPEEDNLSITEVSAGVHVLSNARLDSPWPKCMRQNMIYGGEDRILWNHKSFTFKDAWESCSVSTPEVPWYDLVWNGGRPRWSVHGALILHNAVLTNDNLQRREIAQC
ncbi:uncharacterized protein LOC132300884 isoform X3 [Cornus florida]|uniref:uncharacterized protein LOC132300884 isoform X3 n=1 Tax=Cornus florida TaxID=4283 RepID=UPI00289A57EE|nr:uncharacterized protein LOC132300884 isoform X3 [Cornus florida]